ncbi:MAG TPA: hypothetical protein VKN63_07885, partial [Afifellaceae bacterium]|nr:hypothetical protein [Afifellaceae bacterium]
MGLQLAGHIRCADRVAVSLRGFAAQRIEAGFKPVEGVDGPRRRAAVVRLSGRAGPAGLPRHGFNLAGEAVDSATQFVLARIV